MFRFPLSLELLREFRKNVEVDTFDLRVPAEYSNYSFLVSHVILRIFNDVRDHTLFSKETTVFKELLDSRIANTKT